MEGPKNPSKDPRPKDPSRPRISYALGGCQDCLFSTCVSSCVNFQIWGFSTSLLLFHRLGSPTVESLASLMSRTLCTGSFSFFHDLLRQSRLIDVFHDSHRVRVSQEFVGIVKLFKDAFSFSS